MKTKILLLALSLPTAILAASPKEFTDWPAGAGPAEIGKRVAERFVPSAHLRFKTIVYPEVCAWYGALTFAHLTGDRDLPARLVKPFEPLMTPAGSALV